jgi:hypothetical protein
MSYQKIKQLPIGQLQEIRERKKVYLNSLRGVNGENGIDGLNGEAGKRGYKGDKGIQGIAGQDGARGPAGPQGEKGADGQSIKGDKGDKGEDGKGIDKVYIDQGNLHVVYSDGSDIAVGYIQGPAGVAGIRGRSGTWNGGGDAVGIVSTSTDETISLSFNTYIKQTASGITTTLSGAVKGMLVRIKNKSDNPNTLSLTADGCLNPTINKDETFVMVYNGSDWDIM